MALTSSLVTVFKTISLLCSVFTTKLCITLFYLVQVWLACPFYHPGTLSEYVVVADDLVAPKPSQLTFEGAAALPYSIMTAWDALVTQGGLGPDSTAGKR